MNTKSMCVQQTFLIEYNQKQSTHKFCQKKFLPSFTHPFLFLSSIILIINILQQERNWEDGIEGALLDAGLEVDRGKIEPALLIRKLNDRVKKKKEKVADLKAR